MAFVLFFVGINYSLAVPWTPEILQKTTKSANSTLHENIDNFRMQFDHFESVLNSSHFKNTKIKNTAVSNENILLEGDECSQGMPSQETIPDAYIISSEIGFRSADDFFVEEGTPFLMDRITVDTNQQAVPDDVQIYIREDDNGMPGNVVEMISMEPTDYEIVGSAFDDPIYHLIFELEDPILLTGGTYWIDPQMSSSTGEFIFLAVTDEEGYGSPIYIGTGVSWTLDPDGRNMIFTVSGTCGDVEQCSGTPVGGNIDGPDNICISTPFTLTVQGASSGSVEGISKQWQASPAGQNNWTDIVGATIETYNVQDGISEDTDYRFTVTCSFSGETAVSPTHTVTLTDPLECYCIPEYMIGCESGDYIDDFVLNGQNGTAINSLGTGCSEGSYDDRTDESVDLNAGDTYFANVTTGAEGATIVIWIDFNDSGIFGVAENVGSKQSINPNGDQIPLNIPEDAALGEHRMRVMLSWGGNPDSMSPCGNSTWGETHDYIVNIIEKSDCDGTPDAGAASVNPEQGNPTSAYTVSASGYSLANNLTYQWQSNIDNAGWTNMGNATDAYESYNATAPLEVGVSIDWRLAVTCTTSEETAYSDIATFTTIEPGCGFETPSNNFEDGYGYMDVAERANDFVVPVNSRIIVNQIKLNVMIENDANISFAEINFYEDSSGFGPGNLIDGDFLIPPTSVDFVGNAFDLKVYTVTFDIDPVELQGSPNSETVYWVGVILSASPAQSTYWEVTSTLNSPNEFYTKDSDGTWYPGSQSFGAAADGVMEVIGECSSLGVNDLTSFDFTYYPNPVQDVLNITSKKAVETVEVYNLAGQKVMNLRTTKVEKGQINVAQLTTGTYVFRVVLEGGQVETFKIIKR